MPLDFKRIWKPKNRHYLLLACSIALASLLLATRDWGLILRRNENSHVVSQLGYFGYIVFDSLSVAFSLADESRIKRIDAAPYADYLNEIRERRGFGTPSPRQAKNVIYLQLESIDGFCLWADIDGSPLMPRLRELSGEGLAFSNAHDVTHAGRTVDAELLATASILPLKGKPVFVNYDLSQTPSLPRLLNSRGYETYSIHGYDGYFWNRANSHKALGYKHDYFRESIDSSEAIGWGISDKAVLRFAIDIISGERNPFFAHIILLTHHHPYNHVSMAAGNRGGSLEENAIESIRYVDGQIGMFVDELERIGLKDDTIIAIFGDHDSSITIELANYLGYPLPALWETVPMIVLGMESEPRRISEVVGLQDLPVMVLEELGIEPPSTFVGNSLNSMGRTIGHDGYIRSIVDGKLIVERAPIDVGILTKLSLVRPEALERH